MTPTPSGSARCACGHASEDHYGYGGVNDPRSCVGDALECPCRDFAPAEPAGERTERRHTELREGIASAINRVSAENGSDTPDFILADLLADVLKAFDKAVHARSRWYGHHQSIGAALPSAPREREVAENANERFERHAAAFDKATGMLAPGKDVPAALGGYDEDRRKELWGVFCAGIRAALSPSPDGVQK